MSTSSVASTREASMESQVEALRARLDPLLSGFETRRCIPFLGAGVSVSAELDPQSPYCRTGRREGEHLHSATHMAKRLAVHLAAELRKARTDPHSRQSRWREFVWNDLDWPPRSGECPSKASEVAHCRGDAASPASQGCNPERKREAAEDAAHRLFYGDAPKPDCTWRLASATGSSELDCFLHHVTSRLQSPLGRLSELLSQRCGYAAVCATVRIDQFCHLLPTVAHYALARLIVEDRVPEIITTNYDLCLERAVAVMQGRSMDIDAAHHRPVLQVVMSRHGYMGVLPNGSDAARGSGPPIQPSRYYKINGSADVFRRAFLTCVRGPDEHAPLHAEQLRDAAERIVLTERQLQSFRNQSWAEGLFRDRARSRHLVFSGFGSEEPQVRHTALAIASEFARDGSGGDEKHPWTLGAAPWFHVYGKHLSFYQMQVLLGWWFAWRAEPPPHTRYEDPENWVGGRDGEGLARLAGEDNPHTTNGCATADNFWTAILFELWQREIEAALAPGALVFERIVRRTLQLVNGVRCVSETALRLALNALRTDLLDGWAGSHVEGCRVPPRIRARKRIECPNLIGRAPSAGEGDVVQVPDFVQWPTEREERVCFMLVFFLYAPGHMQRET